MIPKSNRGPMRAVRRVVLLLLVICMICTAAAAETTSAKTASAAERLIELGYLSKDYTPEEFTAAVGDFRLGNDLSEGNELDDTTMDLLMSNKARSQAEYVSGKVQSLHEQGSLSYGAFGEPVEKLQNALSKYGYYSDQCNGAFNASTQEAVQRFQLASGLNVTGIADSAVYLRLYEGEPRSYEEFLEQLTCSYGDTGDQVRTLQVWLRRLGASGFSVTGSYGTLTARAVKAYQKRIGAEETGEADIETVRRITEDILSLSSGTETHDELPPEEIAEVLSLLKDAGYAPDSEMDDQSQLELMKYQRDRALPVTGEPDADTLSALRGGVLPVSQDEPANEAALTDVASFAYSRLGRHQSYASSYGFAEYAYMMCGHELPRESDVKTETLSSVSEAQPGEVLRITEPERVIWGIRTEKQGIVCDPDGIVVLYEPDPEQITGIERVVW